MLKFKNEMIEAAAEQLSVDLACSPFDFLKNTNTTVFSKLMYGRRIFKEEKDFFHLATFGNGTVASVDPEIHSFAEAMLSKMDGVKVFDAEGVYIINKELEKYGKVLAAFNQYYLPKTPYQFPVACEFKLELYEEGQIHLLYDDDKRFQNALLYKNTGSRRDVLAVCAKNGDNIIGMAGATNDSERFWQIGIDVLPEFRQKGLATLLVSTLTHEILMRGAIPYYGTWWSNIASRNVAQNCGYYPVWAEMYAIDLSYV